MKQPAGATIIYRGPLQRSRLSFLGEAAAQRYGSVRLLWVSPRPATKRRVEHFQEFLALNPCFDDWEIIDGRMSALPQAVRRLRAVVDPPEQAVLAVGFTAVFYARRVARGPLVWCVNGIPEERLMSRRGVVDRLMVRLLWRASRWGRVPDLVITVSDRMARLVRDRCGDWPAIGAPNCPVTAFFEAADSVRERVYLTYLGTAAPWQQVDRLAELWSAIHVIAPDARFRVISRDPDCRVLGEGIAKSSIEFAAADDPRQVGAWLAEARLGFLLRAPDLVNLVSSPLKLGEYLVAGAPVVTSDLDWDAADLVRETGCGLLIPSDEGLDSVARRVTGFLNDPDLEGRAAAGAARLRREDHVVRVAARLPAGDRA